MDVHNGSDPRVPLAIERTFLAWVRTGLAMMGFGFVVARFGVFLRELEVMRNALPRAEFGISLMTGTSMVGLGVLVTIYGAFQYHRDLRDYEAGRTVRRGRTTPTIIAVSLAFIGAAAVWYFLRFA